MALEGAKTKTLPEKSFELREATLSKLFRNEHVNAVVQRFGLIFVFYLALNNALNDVYNGGTSEFGFKLIRIGFANPERTFSLWLLMLSSHILVYFGWNVWRAFRPTKSYLWDRIWICTFLIHLFGGFHFSVFLMYELHIPIASRAIILFELPRLMMKSWAFVRTNCRESLAEAKGFEAPTLSEFVYFSFAPTLLYRKEYPRWPTRNWKTMGKHLLELLFIIYTLSLLEDRYLIRPLRDFGQRPFTKQEIFAIIIDNVVVGFVTWIIVVRAILHTSQCFFAELLRFGDREFHEDWWNSSSLSELHIKWNVLVQDWLFHYVYKDFYEHVAPRNKFAARMAVYTLSMVFHEVILTYAVRIICPIYFFFMTASLLITVSKTTDAIVNKFPLFNIVLGQSLLVVVPHLEYFAKENCPRTDGDALLYVPKLYACLK